MPTPFLRHKRFWVRLWVPEKLRPAYGGKVHLEHNLRTSDVRLAEREASVWAALCKAEFAEKLSGEATDAASLRSLYERTKGQALAGEYQAHIADADPSLAGIEWEVDKIAERTGEAELSPADAARLAALQDAAETLQGRKAAPRREYEQSFSELADSYVKHWRATQGLRPTNTEQQKRATFMLFSGFWGDKPIRGARTADAAAFHDEVRLLDPSWARSDKAKGLTWAELLRTYGGRERGLSDATMNRHMAALKSLWEWARKRGHCEGDNPFDGFRRRLRQGVNVDGYRAISLPG